jgi:hypothetical protein
MVKLERYESSVYWLKSMHAYTNDQLNLCLIAIITTEDMQFIIFGNKIYHKPNILKEWTSIVLSLEK